MYSSMASLSMSGTNPAVAACSLKYEIKERAEPSSMSNSLQR